MLFLYSLPYTGLTHCNFFVAYYDLFVFISVRDVFVVYHCHFRPLYCSWGGAVVPRLTQQGALISTVTQHAAASIVNSNNRVNCCGMSYV